MKTKRRIPKPERYQAHYYVGPEEYEYLRRLSVATRGTMQRVIDSRVLGRGWRQELEALRIEQRKLGYKDHEFLPAALRRKMKIKVIPGPRRWKKLRQ